MVTQDIGDALWYAHFGSGKTPVLWDRLPPLRLNSLTGAARSSSPPGGTVSRIIRYAAGITPYIQTIGLYNGKAKNIIATAQALVEQHGGEVPRAREALEALPGVGRKTANVVLNTAFGEPTMAVDTHIFRVANRTGLAPGKTVRVVEDKLLCEIPFDQK